MGVLQVKVRKNPLSLACARVFVWSTSLFVRRCAVRRCGRDRGDGRRDLGLHGCFLSFLSICPAVLTFVHWICFPTCVRSDVRLRQTSFSRSRGSSSLSFFNPISRIKKQLCQNNLRFFVLSLAVVPGFLTSGFRSFLPSEAAFGVAISGWKAKKCGLL